MNATPFIEAKLGEMTEKNGKNPASS